MPKQIQKSQIINWAAKMDDRGNSEVVNLSPNENGITFEYLENADLYYSKALRSRRGAVDLCNGIVNLDYPILPVFELNTSGTNNASGTVIANFVGLPIASTSTFDFPITIIIPSGDMALTNGTINIREWSSDSAYLTNLGAEVGYDIDLLGYVFKLDAVPLVASGASVMSGTFLGTPIICDIALSGTFLQAPGYPYIQYASQAVPIPSGATAVGVASARFTLDTVSTTFPISESPVTEVEYSFNAPVYMSSGSTYAIRWAYNLASGTVARDIWAEVIQNTGTDLSPNTMLGQEFFFTGSPGVPQSYAIRKFGTLTDKPWIHGNLYGYSVPVANNFLNPDYMTSDTNSPFPILSGTNPGGYPSPNSFEGFTTSAEIGQVLPISSGSHTLYGSYFWGGANHTSPYVLYNSDGSLLTGEKNVNIVSNLYTIDNSTGSISGGDFAVTGKTLLATAHGSHVFNFDEGNNLRQGNLTNEYVSSDYRMEKVYTVFDNPVTINSTGANYLLTFGLYDAVTGEKYSDYGTWQETTPPFFRRYASALMFASNGTDPFYSGAAVINYSGNGVFTQFSGTYGYNDYGPNQIDLTCGMIEVPSGNAVVGIHDYRIGADRVSKIVYGQAGEVRYFDLDLPEKTNHVTIFSGISTDPNALMTFATYDDLEFMHDYAQISGICWDQLNSGTMAHGKLPTATITSTISGTNGFAPTISLIPSGVPFSVMIAAEYNSGGYRTQIYPFPSGVVAGPSGCFLQVSGLANQFAFDVPPSHMYAFITEASGSNYYIANTYSGTSNLTGLVNYPYASGTDVVYIERLANQLTDDSFPEVTTYPLNYALSQVATPKLKALTVFYDYLIGIGDPDFSSRLWYSEQYAPQIWGESFDFHGFIDVDKDNGSPLVGMCRLREYLMLFKKNATYRVEFLGTTSEPFSITQVSSKIGALGHFGLVTVGDTVYGLCEYGIFATNGATVNIISDVIDPFYGAMDHTDLTFATAIHDMHEDKIIWSIANDDASPDKNVAIMFNYKEGSFSIRRGSTWNAGNTVYDDDAFDVLLGGTTMGQIQVIDAGEATDQEVLFTDGNNISAKRSIVMTAETPWMSVLDSQINKEMRFIDFNIERCDAILKVDIYFNESNEKRYTRYINLNQSNPDKRVHLGGKAKTVKMVFSTTGNPAFVKIKSMNLYFVPLGQYEEM